LLQHLLYILITDQYSIHYTLSPLHLNKRPSKVKPTLTTTCFFGASYTLLLTGYNL